MLHYIYTRHALGLCFLLIRFILGTLLVQVVVLTVIYHAMSRVWSNELSSPRFAAMLFQAFCNVGIGLDQEYFLQLYFFLRESFFEAYEEEPK